MRESYADLMDKGFAKKGQNMKALFSFTSTKVNLQSLTSAWLFFQREGEVAFAGGDCGKAYRHLNAALFFSEQMASNDPRRTLTLDRLAELAEQTGELAQAASYLNKSLQFKCSNLAPHSRSVLKDYRSLLRVYEKQLLNDEAQSLKDMATKIQERTSSIQARLERSTLIDSRESQSETIPTGLRLQTISAAQVSAVKPLPTLSSLQSLKKPTCA